MSVAQLIVRNIEESVVRSLRKRAADAGVSVEEAHRRLLREALARAPGKAAICFKDFLKGMPDVSDDSLFARPADRPRNVSLH
jgi:hypothetical protein